MSALFEFTVTMLICALCFALVALPQGKKRDYVRAALHMSTPTPTPLPTPKGMK